MKINNYLYNTFDTSNKATYYISDITCTGIVTLIRDPIDLNEAATKGYVDNKHSNINASSFISGTIPISSLPPLIGDIISVNNTITLKPSTVVPDVYVGVDVDRKGIVTRGYKNLTDAYILNVNFNKIINKPTTLAGYGITDGLTTNGIQNVNSNFSIELSSDSLLPKSVIRKSFVDSYLVSSANLQTGCIIQSASSSLPGFLRCNGISLNKNFYSNLFNEVGYKYTGYSMPGNGYPWMYQHEIQTTNQPRIASSFIFSPSVTLPSNFGYSVDAVVNNKVHLISGLDNVGGNYANHNRHVYATINADGTIGPWTSRALNISFHGSSSLVIGNYLYIFGGGTHANNSNVTNSKDILRTTIDANGDLATTNGTDTVFSNYDIMDSPMYRSSLVVTKNRIYLFGSLTYSLGSYFSNNIFLEYKINPDNTITKVGYGYMYYKDYNTTIGISCHRSVIIKNRIYLIGGLISEAGASAYPSNKIFYLELDSTGQIIKDSFGNIILNDILITLPFTLFNFNVITTYGALYIISGIKDLSTTSNNTIYAAAIYQDGSISGFINTGYTTIGGTSGISYPSCCILNNKLYMFGGYNQTSNTPTSIISSVTMVDLSSLPITGITNYSTYLQYDTEAYLSSLSTILFSLPDLTRHENNNSYFHIKM